MNSMKRQKDRTLKDQLPRLVGAWYATGEEQRNSFRRNEEAEQKWKQHPVVDVSGGESKVQCCREQYCIGTWMLGPWIKVNWRWSNRRWQDWTLTFYESVNWNGQEWANLIQMTIISTTVGKTPVEEMEWPSESTKESEMQYLGASSEMTEWSQFISKANHSISVHNPRLCPNH